MGRRRIPHASRRYCHSALLLTASKSFLRALVCVSVQMMLSRSSRALREGTEERTTSSVRYRSAVCPLGMLAVCTCSASKNARWLGHCNFLTCSIFIQSPTQFLRSVPNTRTSSHTSPQNATSAFVFATFSVPASYEGTIAARSPRSLPRAAVPPPASARGQDRFAWNADSFVVDAASRAQGELVVPGTQIQSVAAI